MPRNLSLAGPVCDSSLNHYRRRAIKTYSPPRRIDSLARTVLLYLSLLFLLDESTGPSADAIREIPGTVRTSILRHAEVFVATRISFFPSARRWGGETWGAEPSLKFASALCLRRKKETRLRRLQIERSIRYTLVCSRSLYEGRYAFRIQSKQPAAGMGRSPTLVYDELRAHRSWFSVFIAQSLVDVFLVFVRLLFS